MNNVRYDGWTMYELISCDEYYGDDEIYHYTSINGFDSIMFSNENCLYASRFDCLNDYLEGHIVYEVYKDVCSDLLKEEIIDEEEYKEIIKLRAKEKKLFYSSKKFINVENCNFHSYIISFSKDQDSLPMWNYYSKGNKFEAANIGFSVIELKESSNELFLNTMKSKLVEIIYCRDKQKDILRDKMNIIFNNNKLYRKEALQNLLHEYELCFKSEYFSHENEIRLIIKVPKDNKEDIFYRNNTMTIPYIKFNFDSSVVSNITIGPTTLGKEQIKTQKGIIDDRLKNTGYNSNIYFSKVPIRY